MIPRVRACTLCRWDGKVLLVLQRDPVTGRLFHFPPGGGLEVGETPVGAAERETWEETGYTVRAAPESVVSLHYPFTWAGKQYDVVTHFFAATLIDANQPPEPRPPGSVEFLEAVVWLPVSEALKAMEFDTHIHQGSRRVLLGAGAP